MEILIIDIETTGFLNGGGLIVEIGAASLNLETGEIKEVYNSLCLEDNLKINSEKYKNSWIFSNSDLKFEDVLNARSFETIKSEIQQIINKFEGGCTAFNNAFDFGFLENRGIKFPKKLACPMKLATNLCKLPSKYGYKWPNVEEAFNYFYPEIKYIEKHRGADDSKHEAMIVYELYKRKIFNI
ncbi:MAG: 3'-5' exonuclease [Candidatus Shapirobacteria bacterium]|jgi:DNA polymerase-3 subunit epsilon